MRAIFAIAGTTVGEAIRRRVLLIILLIGVLFLVVAPGLGVLSARSETTVMKGMMLGIIQLTSAVIAIVLTVYMIPNEIERRITTMGALGKRNCRADGRMTGKRQLSARREDADPGAIGGIGRLLDEDGLRQIGFAGDRLHRLVAQVLAVEDDGQRIAGELAVGEHIVDAVAARHIGLLESVIEPPTCPTGETSARF